MVAALARAWGCSYRMEHVEHGPGKKNAAAQNSCAGGGFVRIAKAGEAHSIPPAITPLM